MMQNRIRHTLCHLTAVVMLFLTATPAADAQTLQASRSHYSSLDGLSSNAISHIKQDDYGYLWISTWNGLSRFDGYHFFSYKTGPLSHIPNLHNRINDISIDQGQNIWCRMYDNRVFVLKRSIDQFINPFEGISGNENFRCKYPISVTSNGDVYVIIEGVGVYKMQIEENNISAKLITTGGLKVTSLAEGYQNDVWLGTNQGIHRMDASNLTVERKGFFVDEYVTCMTSNGFNIYAGTESGNIISFAYGQDPQMLRNGDSPLNYIMVDSHGLIWFADDKFGASYLDPSTGRERLFTQMVKTPDYDGFGGYFHESNGIVWARMNHGGFGYYDREKDEIHYFHNDPTNSWSLSNTVYASLELKEGVVWESTSRRGLEKLEIINNNIERRRLVQEETSSLDNEVRALFYDIRRKNLIIGNKRGSIFLFSDEGNLTEISSDSQGHPLGRIYGVSNDSQGNIWLSSKDQGLFCMTYNGNAYTIVNYRHDPNDSTSLSDNRAYQSQEDKQGNLWVATYGGGVNLKLKGSKRFIRPEDMKGYPAEGYHKVRTITMDHDGTIWAGTTDGVLLMKYENGNTDIRLLEPSKEHPEMILLSNDIVCMGHDATGHIWLGTNGGGLSHEIGKDDDGRYLFETFTTQDGLPSEEIKSITFDNRGTVWFAADYTLCSYDPFKRIFSSFSNLEGVDETLCSEASAITLPDDKIIFGTLDGYYVIDKSKLSTSTGSLLKLRITDFWVDDVLQSPRLTETFDYYVPEARQVTLPSGVSQFSFRFAALNYQLQHRVHYQYMLEGYDEDWVNAGSDRTAVYTDIPSGTYKFLVRAFLQESPDKFDQREIEITVESPFIFSKNAVWIYILLLITVGITCLLGYQRFLLRKHGKETDENKRQTTAKEGGDPSGEQKPESEEQTSDAYEIIE